MHPAVSSVPWPEALGLDDALGAADGAAPAVSADAVVGLRGAGGQQKRQGQCHGGQSAATGTDRRSKGRSGAQKLAGMVVPSGAPQGHGDSM